MDPAATFLDPADSEAEERPPAPWATMDDNQDSHAEPNEMQTEQNNPLNEPQSNPPTESKNDQANDQGNDQANDQNNDQTNDQDTEQNGEERPNKRQRFNDGTAAPPRSKNNRKKNKRPLENPDAMKRLQTGLEYVLSATIFTQEDQQYAQILHQRLFPPTQAPILLADPTLKPPPTSAPTVITPMSPPLSSSNAQQEIDQNRDESANSHTDLPPPFAVPTAKAPLQGASLANTALNLAAPVTSTYASLPRMKNHSNTTNLPEPISTELPTLPEIKDMALFHAPFTHVSALSSYIPPTNTNSYEPLEFLGDAYLEVIATRLIHSRFPHHTVGQKAGLREILVKNETLAQYATAYGFPTRIRTAEALKQQQGQAWTKILADVFEAYVACVIIQEDGSTDGFHAAEQWLTELWAPKILDWKAKGDGKRDTTNSGVAQHDAKMDLNKLVAGRQSRLEYRETKPMEMIMPENRQKFSISVFLTGYGYTDHLLGSGEGRSKALASLDAAKDALQNSQDVILIVNRKKVEDEKESKKKTAMAKQQANSHSIGTHRGYNQGGGGGGGHGPHRGHHRGGRGHGGNNRGRGGGHNRAGSPGGYNQGSSGYNQPPVGYNQPPAGYIPAPPAPPYAQAPAPYGQAPAPYSQAPYSQGMTGPTQGAAGFQQGPAGYSQGYVNFQG
jgi:ribonuclease-3